MPGGSAVGITITQLTSDTRPSGSNFNYVITYSCNSINSNTCAINPVITIPLGAAASWPYQIGASSAIKSTAVVNGSLVITLNDMDASSSGTIGLTIVPPNFTTVNNTTWTLQPTLTYQDGTVEGNPPGSVTAPSAVTSTATSTLAISQFSKTANAQYYKPGDTVTYALVLSCAQFASGDENSESITLSDTLPAGLTYVAGSSTLSGIASGTANAVPTVNGQALSWSLTGNQMPSTCATGPSNASGSVTITFRATLANPFPGVDATHAVNVLNTANVSVDPIGSDPAVSSADNAEITVNTSGTGAGSTTKGGAGPVVQTCTPGVANGDLVSSLGNGTCFSQTYPGPWVASTRPTGPDLIESAKAGSIAGVYRVQVEQPVSGSTFGIDDPLPCATGAVAPNFPSSPGAPCADPAFNATYVSVWTTSVSGGDTATGVGPGAVVQALLSDGTLITLPRVAYGGGYVAPVASNGNPTAVLFQVPAQYLGQVASIIVPPSKDLSSRRTFVDIGGYADATLSQGDILQNQASVQFYQSDTTTPVGGPVQTQVGHIFIVTTSKIGISKSVTYTQGTSLAGWTISGTLATKTQAVGDYIFTDTLPVDMVMQGTLISVQFRLNGSSVGQSVYAPTVTIDPVTGQQTVRVVVPQADMNKYLPISGGTLMMNLFIGTNVPYAQRYVNTAQAQYQGDSDNLCVRGALVPGQTPTMCQATATLDVDPTGNSTAVQLIKSVKGSNNSTYMRYPGVGSVPATGGTASFKLNWVNRSALPVNQLVMYDVLPYVGDTGTITATADVQRGSTFTPTFVAMTGVPAGVTVWYSTSSNPCRPEVLPTNPGCVDDWTTTVPADPATVKSLKFTSTNSYAANSGVEITFDMTTPAISPNQVAWNTFASYQKTAAGTEIPVVESSKVGISRDTLALLQVEKVAATPTIDHNSAGTFRISVKNDGNVELTDVTVVDPVSPGWHAAYASDGGVISTTTPQTVSWTIPSLQPGQTVTVTVLLSPDRPLPGGTVMTNRATASADENPAVQAVHPCADDAQYSCTSATIAPYPEFTYGKVVDKSTALPGERLTYTLTVTNTGTAPGRPTSIADYLPHGLTYVSATPTPAGVIADPFPTVSNYLYWDPAALPELAVGQSWTFTIVTTIDQDQWNARLTNLAMVFASSATTVPADNQCTGEQYARVAGVDWDSFDDAAKAQFNEFAKSLSCAETVTPAIDPSLHIAKTASAPADPSGFTVGETVTYTFRVTNVGNVPLEDVAVSEQSFTNAAGAPLTLTSGPTPVGTFDGALAVGQSQDFTGTYVLTKADFDAGRTLSNSAKATGTIAESVGSTAPVQSNIAEATVPVIAPAGLGDRVWLDRNGDGVQSAGEPGLGGATVTVTDSAGTVVATTTTDADGGYSVTGLVPGGFTVTFTPPAGTSATVTGAGTDRAADSNGLVSTVTLTGGQTDSTIDLGVLGTGTIGDTVYADLNGDGAQSAGEPGIGGVVVQLIDSSGSVIGTAVTDADGRYSFGNLLPGDYTVKVDTGTLPAGARQTADPDAVRDSQSSVSLTPEAMQNLQQDFGYLVPAAVGDRVWLDGNRDGLQDAGERGVPGIVVTVRDAGGAVVGTATTDASGTWLVTGLNPGTYAVEYTVPGGYAQTATAAGSDRTIDSNGTTSSVTLSQGQTDRTIDLGLIGTGVIGDTVYSDANGNGVQDAGDTPIAAVTVRLLDSSGAVVATATTDAAGHYQFTGLVPGEYTIAVVTSTLPAGATQTADPDGVRDSRSTVTLTPAAMTDLDQDFGYRAPASLGDLVWYDADGDGIQDAGEPGIPGVVVTVRADSGDVIATTTTDARGHWSVNDLPAGTVTVDFTVPDGYAATVSGAGSDRGRDSNGVRSVVTLAAGQVDRSIDLGLVGTGDIGDTVWLDTNRDGRVDAGERGLGGVLLELRDANGNVIATTTTDAAGHYRFQALPPGSYTVAPRTATVPAGLVAGVAGKGATLKRGAMSDLAQDFGYYLAAGATSSPSSPAPRTSTVPPVSPTTVPPVSPSPGNPPAPTVPSIVPPPPAGPPPGNPPAPIQPSPSPLLAATGTGAAVMLCGGIGLVLLLGGTLVLVGLRRRERAPAHRVR